MRKIAVLSLLLLLAMTGAGTAHAQKTAPLVRSVLFWAEGCPACEKVMSETLPPLQARYGTQLDVQKIEISSKASEQYFLRIEEQYKVPAELRGVPALFIGDHLLVGAQIGLDLPTLVNSYLDAGGRELPNLPGLSVYLPSSDAQGIACVAATPCVDAATQPLTMVNFSSTPLAAPTQTEDNGFWLAWAVLALLVLALLYALGATAQVSRGGAWPILPQWADNVMPLLIIIGAGIAAYLTYVETQQVAAVCGPVGDCNAVQASDYARLFGLLPVGLLGILAYIAMIVAWVVGRFTSGTLAQLAPIALFGMAVFAVLFSIYLTYLELFVILAVCVWCVANAVVLSLLLITSVGPATDALAPVE